MAKRGRKPQDFETKQLIIANRFDSVKKLMEYGYPKYIACKKLGIHRSWFDNNINFEMKRILDEIKYSFLKGKTNREKI